MEEMKRSSQKAYDLSRICLLLLYLTLIVRPSMAEAGPKPGPKIQARGRETGGTRKTVPVPVGVILDLTSSLGAMVNYTINLGVEQFYKNNPGHKTQIVLYVNDSQNDVVAAAQAALDLIENKKVHAILGPQSSEEARLVVKLGNESGVPVIWFPFSGPSLLPPPSQSSIHTHQRPCVQFQAIAAIVGAFGWQSIIPISEDTEYGSDLIPCLTYALKNMNVQLPYISAINLFSTDVEINNTLRYLNKTQTRVFLVHMTPDLGTRFIALAQQGGMMSEGYAWILTQGLSSLTDPKFRRRAPLKGFMQGAVGVKPMDNSDKTNYRRAKEKRYNNDIENWFDGRTLTLYGWWAYDTITALAMAVESEIVGIVNSPLPNDGRDSRVDTGPKLREEIKATYFQGQSGAFNLSQGQLESVFEVYNVLGQKERIIGYWSPEEGLVQNYGEDGEQSGKYTLKEPMWPGDTMDKPPKLRIGVTRTNFTEFVDVEWLRSNKKEGRNGSSRPLTHGFAIDVFKKGLDVLRFPLQYKFVPLPDRTEKLTPRTYDELLCHQIEKKNLDAIIGDITIVANRTRCVDFTLPYLDSSVVMVVKVKQDSQSKLVLFQPFHWSLWLLLGGVFVGATIVAIILENGERSTNEKRKENNEGTEKEKEEASPEKEKAKGETSETNNTGHVEKSNNKQMELIFNPFLIYKIDIKGAIESDMAKWIVILTSFLFVMVTQVYTANLASILTEGKTPKPSWDDLEKIKNDKSLYVGYQRDSWVKGLLIEQIGFDEHRLRDYGTLDEYNEALSKGRVVAIFDENPYLDLFLSKYRSQFMRVGTIYKTGGFAFAFPKKSNLVSYFSNAILNVTQDVETFRVLRTKSSLPTTIDDVEYEYQSDSKTSINLSIDDIKGLFPIVLYVVGLFFGIGIVKLITRLHQRWRGEKMNKRENKAEDIFSPYA